MAQPRRCLLESGNPWCFDEFQHHRGVTARVKRASTWSMIVRGARTLARVEETGWRPNENRGRKTPAAVAIE